MSEKNAIEIAGERISLYPQRMEDNKLYPIFYRGKKYFLCKTATAISLYEEKHGIAKIAWKAKDTLVRLGKKVHIGEPPDR